MIRLLSVNVLPPIEAGDLLQNQVEISYKSIMI